MTCRYMKKNSEVRMQVRASRGAYGLLTAPSSRGSLGLMNNAG
jgi:hypothetical protein